MKAVPNNFRKLILTSLDWGRPKDPPLSLGLASILATAKSQRFDVDSLCWRVNSSEFSPKKVSDAILRSYNYADCDIAFGVFVWNEKQTQIILNNLKSACFQGRIIVGGPQISYAGAGDLETFYPQVDVFIRGYAEEAMISLMSVGKASTLPSIKGVHFARSGRKDSGESAVVSFDNLASPFTTGIILPQPFIRWETQRGCFYRCNYCQHREPNHALEPGKRYMPPSRTVAEIDWILQNKVIQDIAVLDPVFNSGPHHLAILERLVGYTGKIALQVRIELITEAFLNACAKINAQGGRVVLEFGLQTIHLNEMILINRKNNVSKAAKILLRTKEMNIDCEVSLIFGLPGQTLQSFKESVDFCIQLNVQTIHAFPLMLLRGTPMEQNKSNFGLVESNEIASDLIPRQQEDIPHVVSGSSFTYSDWQQMAEIAAALEKDYNSPKAK
jgi:radical SAM superfamily enzyme YgiQ (UPF0313 family)